MFYAGLETYVEALLTFNLFVFVFPFHRQYKYQINIDGTVAAYRLPYLLAGDSLVLKQDSIYYEHFYNELRPWEHYIPVRADLSDLLEKIQWAREHDQQVSFDSDFMTHKKPLWLLSLFSVLLLFVCRQRRLHWQVSSLHAIT